jgi:hypothetical protein
MSLLPKTPLTDWMTNVPDYYDVTKAYEQLGALKSKIIMTKREIERVEEESLATEDKPRSNEARSRKVAATSNLKDTLAHFEAELAKAEAKVKTLEYRKSMFSSATYSQKLRLEVPFGEDS